MDLWGERSCLPPQIAGMTEQRSGRTNLDQCWHVSTWERGAITFAHFSRGIPIGPGLFLIYGFGQ
jgi:hypothetical protein